MTQQTYVFRTELVGFPEVRRTITVRDDLTLVDLHYALQSAFGWDDDHLYSFWLDGSFWACEDEHYTRPYQAVSVDPPGKSACACLRDLGLAESRKIAYEFDFERHWRVVLELREIRPSSGTAVARCIEREGVAPPQYPDVRIEQDADPAQQPTVDFVALMVEEADAA